MFKTLRLLSVENVAGSLGPERYNFKIKFCCRILITFNTEHLIIENIIDQSLLVIEDYDWQPY